MTDKSHHGLSIVVWHTPVEEQGPADHEASPHLSTWPLCLAVGHQVIGVNCGAMDLPFQRNAASEKWGHGYMLFSHMIQICGAWGSCLKQQHRGINNKTQLLESIFEA
jgi:hypothetical protein